MLQASFENVLKVVSLSLKQRASVPSFQHRGLQSRSTRMSPEASLRAWMPAIHAGMTNAAFSSSVGERTIMNQFLVIYWVFQANCESRAVLSALKLA
jgi:hypothetical protein